MPLDQLRSLAVEYARGRFEVLPADDRLEDCEWGPAGGRRPGDEASRDLSTRILQLRRIGRPEAGRRTLLMTALVPDQPVSDALRWAARVRDRLRDEEAADLYLMLLIPGLDSNDAPQLESDESFCRKYAAPLEGDPHDMLQRTFLGSVEAEAGSKRPSEPLAAALHTTAAGHDWMTDGLIAEWHKALLTDEDGQTLAPKFVGATSMEVP